ncbi:hypothetical protein ZWY2020_005406 [Hordeum vulgare]|nr:hypothetical protein ZWY2020_005406 [Hordeum vulgare]
MGSLEARYRPAGAAYDTAKRRTQKSKSFKEVEKFDVFFLEKSSGCKLRSLQLLLFAIMFAAFLTLLYTPSVYEHQLQSNSRFVNVGWIWDKTIPDPRYVSSMAAQWDDVYKTIETLYPEWIDEEEETEIPSCPSLSEPNFPRGTHFDVIAVKLPCTRVGGGQEMLHGCICSCQQQIGPRLFSVDRREKHMLPYCIQQLLMEHINEITSYNGGDQGYLNEIFTWWHRIPKHMNFLKHFWEGDEEEVKAKKTQLFGANPPILYALHYLGRKPWLCFRTMTATERSDTAEFASDIAHTGGGRQAEKANFTDGHWKRTSRTRGSRFASRSSASGRACCGTGVRPQLDEEGLDAHCPPPSQAHDGMLCRYYPP